MATFHVGQRVKKIAYAHWPRRSYMTHVPIGTEGTIRGRAEHSGHECWLVDFDCYRVSEVHRQFFLPFFYMTVGTLTPLIDPKAQEFIDRMRMFAACSDTYDILKGLKEFTRHADHLFDDPFKEITRKARS